MTNTPFEELIVPAPPYRMARPVVATLAAAKKPPAGTPSATGGDADKPLGATIGERTKDALDLLAESRGVGAGTPEEAPSPETAAARTLQESLDRTLEVLAKNRDGVLKHPQGRSVIEMTERALDDANTILKLWRDTLAERTEQTPAPSTPPAERQPAPEPAPDGEKESLDLSLLSPQFLEVYQHDRKTGNKKGVATTEAWIREQMAKRKQAESPVTAPADAEPEKEPIPTEAPVVESVKEPVNTSEEGKPKVLNTLREERESLIAHQRVMDDPKFLQRLKEYDEAIKAEDERRAKPSLPPELKPADSKPIGDTATNPDNILTPEDRARLREAGERAGLVPPGIPEKAGAKERSDETAAFRELRELESKQRDLEKQAEEAGRKGDAAKATMLRDGIIELEMQIGGKRAELQGDLTDEQMKDKEQEYARKEAVVAEYHREYEKAADEKMRNEQVRSVIDAIPRVAREKAVREIANESVNRSALSPTEWARFKELVFQEKKIEADNEASQKLTEAGILGRQVAMMGGNEMGELLMLRQRLQERQIARGEQMREEEEHHDEALQEAAERRLPRPDRLDFGSFLRGGLRRVFERSGARAWFETFRLRLHTWETRTNAIWDTSFQERAQKKLDFAQEKVREYTGMLQDVGIMGRMWYGNRLRKWQARAASCEGRVQKWSSDREARLAEHAAYQREVISVYERELGPYRELARDLSDRLDVQRHAREALTERRNEAVQRLSAEEAAGRRGRFLGIMGPRAARCVADIRREIAEMDRHIKAAIEAEDKYDHELTAADATIAKWQGKINVVAQSMAVPEIAKVTAPPPIREVPIPPAPRTTPMSRGQQAARRTEAAAAAPAQEADPSQREWPLDRFVGQWNARPKNQLIEDAPAFMRFVQDERSRLRQTGNPRASEIRPLLERYLSITTRKFDRRQFADDWRTFLTQVRP